MHMAHEGAEALYTHRACKRKSRFSVPSHPLPPPPPGGDDCFRVVASISVADGEPVQQFKTLWDCKRKFYTVPVHQ